MTGLLSHNLANGVRASIGVTAESLVTKPVNYVCLRMPNHSASTTIKN